MWALLIDADSVNGFPNLALMKLSASLKAKGASVDLIRGIPETPPLVDYDRAFLSCVFFQNAERAKAYAESLNYPVELGGSGIDLTTELPYDIEHIRPDYALYPTPFSIGFTSRGCIRKCGFCVVSKKEGHIRDHAPITEFHNPDHRDIVLLDNNFLASPRWRENLAYIRNQKLRVNFNSGLDIRLMSSEIAGLLHETKCRDWTFKTRKIAFAFDSPSIAKAVVRGIDLLRDAGFTKNDFRNVIMFYVLVGYNTTPIQDLERLRLLMDRKVGFFVMRFNQAEGPHRILYHLARWANRMFYQYFDFADYNCGDSLESYKAVFGNGPDPSWRGVGCPQAGNAWANRTGKQDPRQEALNDE